MIATPPQWTELVRALWPIFVVLAGLSCAGVILGLKSIFSTVANHKDHEERICDIETFVTKQETALTILPSRQDLGQQIAAQGVRINDIREDLSEQLSEQGERIAGVEAGMRGMESQLETSNQYLRALLEQGLRK